MRRSYYACFAVLALVASPGLDSARAEPPKAASLQGTVTKKIQNGTNGLWLLIAPEKEIRLLLGPTSLIHWNQRTADLGDVPIGAKVAVIAIEDRDGNLVISNLVGPVAPQLIVRQGKVLKVLASDDTLILQTSDGKETAFTVLPDSRLLVGARAVKLIDVPVGAEVTVTCYERDGEFVVATLEMPLIVVSSGARMLQAKVIKVMAPERMLLLEMPDGKEIHMRVPVEARVVLNGRTVKLLEIPIKTPVSLAYAERNGEYIVTALEGPVFGGPAGARIVSETTVVTEARVLPAAKIVTEPAVVPAARIVNESKIVPVATIPAEGISLDGKVVKVYDRDDQLTIITTDGKRYRLMTVPESRLYMERRPVRLTDIPAAMEVHVIVDERDGSYVIRNLEGVVSPGLNPRK